MAAEVEGPIYTLRAGGPALTLAADRDRARRLATTIVSLAIAIAGLVLVVFAVLLVVRGGLGFVFLALLILLVGGALAALGFFFQLVPFRLAELEAEKREHDRKLREQPR